MPRRSFSLCCLYSIVSARLLQVSHLINLFNHMLSEQTIHYFMIYLCQLFRMQGINSLYIGIPAVQSVLDQVRRVLIHVIIDALVDIRIYVILLCGKLIVVIIQARCAGVLRPLLRGKLMHLALALIEYIIDIRAGASQLRAHNHSRKFQRVSEISAGIIMESIHGLAVLVLADIVGAAFNTVLLIQVVLKINRIDLLLRLLSSNRWQLSL